MIKINPIEPEITFYEVFKDEEKGNFAHFIHLFPFNDNSIELWERETDDEIILSDEFETSGEIAINRGVDFEEFPPLLQKQIRSICSLNDIVLDIHSTKEKNTMTTFELSYRIKKINQSKEMLLQVKEHHLQKLIECIVSICNLVNITNNFRKKK